MVDKAYEWEEMCDERIASPGRFRIAEATGLAELWRTLYRDDRVLV